VIGADPRIICGQDVRSRGPNPSDGARLEAFVGRFGGMLEAYPVGSVGIAVRWIGPDGRELSRTGATFTDALQRLQAGLGEVS